ncbi:MULTISPECIES: PaaI family thioesterase [unclassified Marinovum]
MSPEKIRDLNDSFARQSLMATFGATIDEMAPGKVKICAPISASARQQHGFGHAGLTFSLGDTAAGYAALSLMPEGAEVLTAEIKINLLAPARGQSLRACGEVIKAGRRLVVVRASVWALDGGKETEIALLQGTMIPV